MFIGDLKELIIWYDENKIPYDTPMGCSVEYLIDANSGKAQIQISDNVEWYGINLQHLDTTDKKQTRIDETRFNWLSHMK